MKDSDYVMYLWNEIEMRRKEKEARKKMMQNQKSDIDSEGKKEKYQHRSVEKTVLDKEQKKDINEEVAKPGVTLDNIHINAGISVSSGPKSVHQSADEPAKEDVGTSRRQNDVLQISSQAKRQKLACEDVRTSDQQNDVAQEKQQKPANEDVGASRQQTDFAESPSPAKQ